MTKNTNTSMRRFAAKCLWIWGMVMAFVASAEAENKVTIDNFNIKVDEEKTISVYLENSDPMVGLQMRSEDGLQASQRLGFRSE